MSGRLKLIGLVLIALVALGGVAKGAGVLDGGSASPAFEGADAKVARLEDRFEALAKDGEGATSVAARVGNRGPRGARGPKGARGPRGAKGSKGATGAAGAKGATGAAGPKGTFGAVGSYAGVGIVLGPFGSASAVGSTQAACPPGTVLTGGGYTGAGILTTVTYSAPVANSWGIIAANLDEERFVNGLKAYAICASP